MTRPARVVVAGVPHHVKERGNRRQQTFFRDEDYKTYLSLWQGRFGSCPMDRPHTLAAAGCVSPSFPEEVLA